MDISQHQLLNNVPVVDLRVGDSSDEDEASVAKELMQAFTTIGFVYLTNFGITQDEVDKMMLISKQFFDLPIEDKMKYVFTEKAGIGYIPEGTQTFEGDKPADIRESFDLRLNYATASSLKFPEAEVPELKPAIQKFCDECKAVTNRILKLLAVGLNLKDLDFFIKAHDEEKSANNCTAFRTLFYRSVPPTVELASNQMRCGEHSDWGTITLLFQDQAGGLEVMNRNGLYVKAYPMKGSVLVNIGDLLQRWTSGKLVSAKHRVVVPPEIKTRYRQSIAYFVSPNDDVVVEPIDRSPDVSPVLTSDYFAMKMRETFY